VVQVVVEQEVLLQLVVLLHKAMHLVFQVLVWNWWNASPEASVVEVVLVVQEVMVLELVQWNWWSRL
jgi:hypothetical protein